MQGMAMAAEDSTVAERRRAERSDVSKEITFFVDSERNRIANNAFAVDLSTLGARIRTGLHLRPGQHVTVIPREGSDSAIPSRVVWASEPGRWGHGEVGLAFLQATALEV